MATQKSSTFRSRATRALCRSMVLPVLVATMAVSCGDDDDGDDDTGGGRGGSSVGGKGGTGGTSAGKGGTSGTAGKGGTAGQGGAAGQGGDAGAPVAGAAGDSGGAAGFSGAAGADDGAGGTGGADDGALEVEGDRRIPFTPRSDLAFVDYFIAHHEMAIAMAEEVVERGSTQTVIELAQSIITTQSDEVATLEGIRAELDGESDPMPADPHSEADMDHMSGMTGVELDTMFLLDMIPHHATALPSAHRAIPYLERAELVQMAEQIEAAQAREIGEIRALLAQLGVTTAGEDMAPAGGDRADHGLIGDRRIPLTPEDDVEFIDFFVPHHQVAVEMADHVIAHGENAEIVAMAEAMQTTQTADVGQTSVAGRKLRRTPNAGRSSHGGGDGRDGASRWS
jgi:uncharacterized protein (DUF305 family)